MKIVNGLAIIFAIVLPFQAFAVTIKVSPEACAETPSYQELANKYSQQMQAAEYANNNTLYAQAKHNYATAKQYAEACDALATQHSVTSTSTQTQ